MLPTVQIPCRSKMVDSLACYIFKHIFMYIKWSRLMVRMPSRRKEVVLPIAQILNWIWNPEAWTFEIWTNGYHFVKNQLKAGKNIKIYEYSCFQMDKTLTNYSHSHITTLWKPTIEIFKKSGFEFLQILIGRISDPYCSTWNTVRIWNPFLNSESVSYHRMFLFWIGGIQNGD